MLKNTLIRTKGTVTAAIAAATVFMFNTMPAMAQGLISPTDQPSKLGEATGGQGSFRELIKTFLDFGLGFLGLIAVIMIIYGGILYVTAAGETDKADKAKKIIMYAIVGIVIILLSFALVNTILGGLGAGQDV